MTRKGDIHRWRHQAAAVGLVVGLTAVLAGCSVDKIVDPPPSQTEPTGLELAQVKCPGAPVLTTMSEPAPAIIISDDTRDDRHMTCVMKALDASNDFLRQVEQDRRLAERSADSEGGSDEWRSEPIERQEAGYTYEYTFTSGSDRLIVTENSP
jgi:hypothetical protein